MNNMYWNSFVSQIQGQGAVAWLNRCKENKRKRNINLNQKLSTHKV